jgi:hypothetical protein
MEAFVMAIGLWNWYEKVAVYSANMGLALWICTGLDTVVLLGTCMTLCTIHTWEVTLVNWCCDTCFNFGFMCIVLGNTIWFGVHVVSVC